MSIVRTSTDNLRPADEITQIAAANIGWEMLALMAKTPLTE